MSQNVVSLREPAGLTPDAPPADPAEAARGTELQAQQRPRLFRAVWRWHFAITLGLGVFFPLLGISILVLLLFDLVIVRHVPPLRRALGAS
jgi:uncharacterized iron-regulated membrane protein